MSDNVKYNCKFNMKILTLNQTFLFAQTEVHESVGVLQQDLQHVVFAINLCDILFDTSKGNRPS